MAMGKKDYAEKVKEGFEKSEGNKAVGRAWETLKSGVSDVVSSAAKALDAKEDDKKKKKN